jgi:hypothetical protein
MHVFNLTFLGRPIAQSRRQSVAVSAIVRQLSPSLYVTARYVKAGGLKSRTPGPYAVSPDELKYSRHPCGAGRCKTYIPEG